jgi:hypothetical protein
VKMRAMEPRVFMVKVTSDKMPVWPLRKFSTICSEVFERYAIRKKIQAKVVLAHERL